MAHPNPSLAQLYGRLGGLRARAAHDPLTTTAPGRAAFMASFEARVDPDGVLLLRERQARAAALRKAHFTELQLRSAAAQAERAGSSKPRAEKRALAAIERRLAALERRVVNAGGGDV